ncbi:MAG: hypothetical protein NPIRA03_41920 [Nitrospirales bacterium]|nr:MAG: hypothetical protein NPIRA03_41920 [Nitrospirales bacterium]
MKRFLDGQPAFPKGHDGQVHLSRVAELLSRVLYTGMIDYPKWDIHLLPGKHEPLISYGTYQIIQNKLNGTAKAPARKDIHEDFPLRGFVTCGCCGVPLRSCWSKGRNQKYPYYLCHTKACNEYGKSIRKETMEEEFGALLQDMRPTPNLFYMALEMFKELWSRRQQQARQESMVMQGELRQIGKKVDQLLDRVVEADSPILVETYENKIRGLQEQKLMLREKIKHCGRPLQSFDESFRTAFDFLGNPYKLWGSGRLEDQRMVLRLAFSEKLPYDRNGGYRTAQTALPFKVLGEFQAGESEMVRPTGVEPVTS